MKNTLQLILLLTIIPQILTAQIDTLFSMSQTKEHFIKDDTIWMISDGGVVKRTCTTGTILATFTPANSPIPYHRATGIWVDLQHRMWIYLEETGIAMLNGNQWTTWDVEDAHYVMAGGYNGKVAVDNDGVAWIAAPYRTPMCYKNGAWQQAPNPTFVTIDSRSMKIGPDGKLWVVNGFGGIFRHTGTQWEKLAPTITGIADFAISAAGDFYTCASENGTTTLYHALSGSTDLVPISTLAGDAQRMAVSPSGRVWIAGKFAQGIAFYENDEWKYLSEGEYFPDDWYHLSLSVDAAGRLWDTKYFYGTKVHDGTSWQRVLNGPIGFEYGVNDQDGSIWFGYLNTLSKYNPATGETTYKYLNAQQLFQHNNIMAMEQGPNGTFYAASQRGPIHWYDGNGNFQTVYEQTGATGAWDAYVRMQVDQSDNLYYQGIDAFSDLIQYNAKTNKYLHIAQYHNNTPTIPFDNFYHFETDGLDRLWLYTEKGLVYWKNGAWKTFFEPGPAPDVIEHMVGGASGVWICSPSVQTVYYFDASTSSSWNLPLKSNTGEQIFKLFTDSRNWLWCITNQQRVLCFTGYSWKVYDANLGNFPAYTINTLFEDHEGNMWFLNGADIAIRLTIPTGRLSGQLIDDVNLDCTIQPDEQGIRGYKIVLDNGQQKIETIADINGRFGAYMTPGNYTMFISSVNNLGESCQSGIPVTIVQGQQQEFQIPVKTILHTPIMSVRLSTPFTRRCWETTYTVQVCNDGNLAADSTFVSMELPAGLTFVSATIPYSVEANGRIIFRPGKVEPGFCNHFSFKALVGCDDSVVLGQSLCITAHVSPDTLPTIGNGSWTGASMRVRGHCAGDKVIFEVKNEGKSATLAPLPYDIIKDEYLHETGVLSMGALSAKSFELLADGSTWRFSMGQEAGRPFAAAPSFAVEGCVATGNLQERSSGFVTQAANATGSPFDFTDCHDVVGSFDPNIKECQPKGWGELHRILPQQALRYQIHFQNTGTDTAFSVVVRDTLDVSLDWNSFRPEIASHPFRVEKDSIRRAIAFIFEPIMLPDSTRNEPASHGFIQFTIRPQPAVPLGTVVLNTASIYFDFNKPVVTNTVLHTIDTGFIRLKPVPPNYETLSALAFAPNPANTGTWVALDAFDKEQSYRLELYDTKGRLVRSSLMPQSPFWLERNVLPSGVYQAVVLWNGKRIATGQIVFD